MLFDSIYVFMDAVQLLVLVTPTRRPVTCAPSSFAPWLIARSLTLINDLHVQNYLDSSNTLFGNQMMQQ